MPRQSVLNLIDAQLSPRLSRYTARLPIANSVVPTSNRLATQNPLQKMALRDRAKGGWPCNGKMFTFQTVG